MKRFLFTIFLLGALSPLAAQLYHPGEQLFYRVSYKAKMFPNTEVGTVEVKTSEDTADGKSYYKVEGAGRTLPTYRWFFNLEDLYTVWIDREALRRILVEPKNSIIKQYEKLFEMDGIKLHFSDDTLEFIVDKGAAQLIVNDIAARPEAEHQPAAAYDGGKLLLVNAVSLHE